jgi:hypothetical protein
MRFKKLCHTIVTARSPHDPVRIADVYGHWIDYIAQHFK